MKKFNKNEKGQALVGGIVFLLISMLFCAYFIYVCESFARKYSNEEKAKEEVIVQAAKVANALDQISINNQSIIAAVVASQNAFAKAFELGIYVSYEQPYWKTYGSLTQKSNSLEASNAVIKKAYQAYALTAARGFFIAKSLSEKNKNLVARMPKKISSYFKQSSNAQVHCFALETQKDRYQKPGFVNFPVPKSYPFFLIKNECGVEHRVGKIREKIQKGLPFLYSSESNEVLSYKKIDKFNFSENLNFQDNQYGIWFVNPSQQEQFFKALEFKMEKSVDTEKKYSVFDKYLSGIPFFKNINLASKKNLSAVLSHSKIYISHPNIACSENQKCSSNEFLHAFFFPNWAALVTEKEINIERDIQ
jgi:Na+-transporting methylmalonyl-CoA/oxaloacetate decarboxylase gamma subunit